MYNVGMDKINSCNFFNDIKETVEDFSSLGNRLRQARKSMGLTQKSVAKSLCLKLSVIQGIEKGYLDQLGISSIFLYGYIRSYARLVGIDSEKIMTPVVHGLNPVSSVRDGNRFRIFYLRNSGKDKIRLLVFLCFIFFVFVMIVLLLIVCVLKYFPNKKEDANVLSLNPISFALNVYSKNNLMFISEEKFFNRNCNIFNDNYYYVNDKIRYPFCSVCYFSEVFDRSLNDMRYYDVYDDMFFYVFNNIMKYTIDNISNLNNDMLIMSFLSDCWVEVFDSSGKRLYVGTQCAGNVLNLIGEIPYKLIIGAPQAVKIEYRGNIVSLDKFINPYKVGRIMIPDLN